MALKQLTLLLLRYEGQILLGMKKRGFGAGKYNGFGGKIEPLETIQSAAVREMEEESGLRVLDPVLVGLLDFDFLGSTERLRVHVFTATAYSGVVRESDEMQPQWFSESAVPFDSMWKDDELWFPLLLSGRNFKGTFLFNGHDEIVSHTLETVPRLPCDASDVLVTAPQGAITV